MTDEQPTAEEPQPNVLRFEPPLLVYRIEVTDEMQTVVKEPLQKDELTSQMQVAILNPWNDTDEERFLPGIAYGANAEDEYVMDVGESFGALKFHEELGWVCMGLLPKKPLLQRVAEELKKVSFTQRLVKKASKGKKRE